MKKFIFFFSLIVVVIAGAAYVFAERRPHTATSQVAATVSAYSLNGQVVSVSSQTVTVTVGRVENTAGGEKFVSMQKEWALAPTMSFVEGTSVTSIAAAEVATRLKVGDRAVFSGSGTASPWTGPFTVSKIEITSRAEPAPTLPRSAPVVR